MHTYKVELRHAPSKNRLNALRNNRLPPLIARLPADADACAWARSELLHLAKRRPDPDHRYLEAAVWRLLPIGPDTGSDDALRVGRWVRSSQGLNWRRPSR